MRQIKWVILFFILNVFSLNVISGEAQISGADSFAFMQERYCLRFDQINRNQVAGYIKDMEKTAYTVDEYLQTAGCTPGAYGGNVKAPILHLVADHPASLDDFLPVFFNYYDKKRKDTSLFTKAINAKSTKGETLLDYIEYQNINYRYNTDEYRRTIKIIIEYLCTHGGVYSKYSDKSCQNISTKANPVGAD